MIKSDIKSEGHLANTGTVLILDEPLRTDHVCICLVYYRWSMHNQITDILEGSAEFRVWAIIIGEIRLDNKELYGRVLYGLLLGSCWGVAG